MTTDKIGAHDVDDSIAQIIDARSEEWDMDAVLTGGVHFKLYDTNIDTLGTPYKYGKTTSSAAIILSYNNDGNFGYQQAFLSGFPVPMLRTLINGVIGEWSTGFLPLSGGDGLTTNTLWMNNKFGCVYIGSAYAQLESYTEAGGNYSKLRLLNPNYDLSGLLKIQRKIGNVDGMAYSLFGQHNKPSGTYTGNGQARTIQIGGIGNTVLVRGGSGIGSVIVTTDGGIQTYSGTVRGVGSPYCSVTGGCVLNLSADSLLNQNGVTYTYQVL